MREYLKLLQTSALFEGISEDEILQLLVCLNANIRVFGRGETVLRLGEDLEHIGLVLNGRVLVFRDGLLGERTLIAQVSKGGLFAEALAFARIRELPVSVEALEKSEILFLKSAKLLATCHSNCVFHRTLVSNMMSILAQKSLLLSSKIRHISKRTTREKLLSYLYEQASASQSTQFIIPFNRQELADYLCVDRSAMSNELSKLQQEGILSFHKSAFKLMEYKQHKD